MNARQFTLVNEHAIQHEILDLLETAASAGVNTLPMFRRLLGFTQVHFHCEEVLMKEHRYDQLYVHEMRHIEILQQLDEYDTGSALSVDQVHEIKCLIDEHNATHDEAFNCFLIDR